VIPLPEKPKPVCLGKGFCCADRKCDVLAWEEACAYARDHPIDVEEKSARAIKFQLKYGPDGTKRELQDLTEYKVEGVRMEIKQVIYCERQMKYVDPSSCSSVSSCMCGYKQIACLMADDKPKEI
jgi:hypothetical protein